MRNYISVGAKTGGDPEPIPEKNTTVGQIPEVGDRKTFRPTAFELDHAMSLLTLRADIQLEVTGTVDYVNAAHRWYRVRYETPRGGIQHECFKF